MSLVRKRFSWTMSYLDCRWTVFMCSAKIGLSFSRVDLFKACLQVYHSSSSPSSALQNFILIHPSSFLSSLSSHPSPLSHSLTHSVSSLVDVASAAGSGRGRRRARPVALSCSVAGGSASAGLAMARRRATRSTAKAAAPSPSPVKLRWWPQAMTTMRRRPGVAPPAQRTSAGSASPRPTTRRRRLGAAPPALCARVLPEPHHPRRRRRDGGANQSDSRVSFFYFFLGILFFHAGDIT